MQGMASPDNLQGSAPVVIHHLDLLLSKLLKRCVLGLSDLHQLGVPAEHPVTPLGSEPPHLEGGREGEKGGREGGREG